MIKAPRRSVASPGGGGALPTRTRRVQPRSANGQFATIDTIPVAGTSPKPEVAKPKPAKPAKPSRVEKTVVAKGGSRTTPSTPAQLVTRVTRAIERELEEIEAIIGGTPTEADKRARTLASLARTLAEVMRLRNETKTTKREAKANHDDDAVPRDLADFRRTLERRLAQLVDPPEVVPAGGDDAG